MITIVTECPECSALQLADIFNQSLPPHVMPLYWGGETWRKCLDWYSGFNLGKEVLKMEAKKMLAVLGAMSVAATAVPVVAAITRDESEQKNGDSNVLLYSGSAEQAQSVSWHSSHGSHTSHGSHSSSRY